MAMTNPPRGDTQRPRSRWGAWLRVLGSEGRTLVGLAIALAGGLLATALRYGFVEPEAFGAACERSGPWWCLPRTALIQGLEWRALGWGALALAGLALWAAWRGCSGRGAAWAAMALGGAGLVLYNATLSGIALVLAGLVLARRAQGLDESPDFRAHQAQSRQG
jgi:hypothetical protein